MTHCCIVDHASINLLQLAYVLDRLLVNTYLDHRSPKWPKNVSSGTLNLARPILDHSPDLVVNWVQIWTTRRPHIWTDESGVSLSFEQHHCFMGTMCWCIVMLKDKQIACDWANGGQHLILQQHITVVGAISPWRLAQQILDRCSQVWTHRQKPWPTWRKCKSAVV